MMIAGPNRPAEPADHAPPGADRVLITAGPTREHIDSVRFISNASSGKMGFELARAARDAGHPVTLVTGPVDIPDPRDVETIRVVSAAEMLAEAERVFADCAAAIMAAAVCDFRPVERADKKRPKSEVELNLRLAPTVDICARLGAARGDRIVIGFAMEDHDHRARAEEKLRRKQCDAIVMNDASQAGADSGGIEVYDAGSGWGAPVHGSKTTLARAVVALMDELLARRRGRPGRGR